MTEKRSEEAKEIRRSTGTNPKRAKEITTRNDSKVGADSKAPTLENTIVGGDFRYDEGFRWRDGGKTGTAHTKESCGQFEQIGHRIRRLTPRECGRLQTVPPHHLEIMLSSGISDTQLYRMFGNGWTVSVIAYIFLYYKMEEDGINDVE